MLTEEQLREFEERLKVSEEEQAAFVARYGDNPALYAPPVFRKMNFLIKKHNKLVADYNAQTNDNIPFLNEK